jgi:hypothetical protein
MPLFTTHNLSTAAADAAQHRRWFFTLCRYEKELGGPDQQLPLVAALGAGRPPAELAWRAGCYVGPYNTPAAERLWTEYPTAAAVTKAGDVRLLRWLRGAWKELAVRTERRCVRRPEQMCRFLSEYAAWVELRPWEAWADYAAGWASCDTVYTLGRFARHKLLEFGRRYCGWPTVMPDVRPEGGWSPRRALGFLYPEHKTLHNREGDSPEAIRAAHEDAEKLRAELLREGLDLTWYDLQTLLCEYKEAYEGLHHHPGRALDSDLECWTKMDEALPGFETEFFAGREKLFPPEARGELNGWAGKRKDLGELLGRAGVVWSDLHYDYRTNKYRLHNPVRRS